MQGREVKTKGAASAATAPAPAFSHSTRLKLERRTFAQSLEAVATLLARGGFVGYLPTHFTAAVARQHSLAQVSGAGRLAHDTKIVMATVQSHELSPAGRLLADLLLKAHLA